ncbi:hypothetical protein N9Y60_01065 [Crocinitomicaceae bacterium]|nr:hypothetical protein [Crocinitomicaceae bacterium]MDB3906228.1 hypothetical protein [Crocinitomicaceae bacterium]
MKLVRLGLMLLVLLFVVNSNAQLNEYNQERLQMDKRLMLSLGSWATTNLAVGGIGWATTPKGEAHYFHQMNFFWNTVNVALAVPGYLKARKESSNLNFAETLRAQNKTETIFLINSGLDIAYMSSGLLLRSEARFNPERKDQWTGYGNSLLLQGGFLFVFDLTAYILHKRHYNKKLNGFLDQIELSQNGLGMRWNIPSHSVRSYQSSIH